MSDAECHLHHNKKESIFNRKLFKKFLKKKQNIYF